MRANTAVGVDAGSELTFQGVLDMGTSSLTFNRVGAGTMTFQGGAITGVGAFTQNDPGVTQFLSPYGGGSPWSMHIDM
jgi:hypothetical protein